MRKAVDLVLPDTGPLITLAAADRLDLLQAFGRPVRVLDVVKEECLQKPGGIGHDELAAWFASTGGNQHSIVETPMIHAWRAALGTPRPHGSAPATKGMGDAALVWFEQNLEYLHERGTTMLILTEDANLGDVRLRGKAHVLSTRAFLTTLENIGVLTDAADVIQAVQDRGRRISRYLQDRRGVTSEDATTDWVMEAQLAAELARRGRGR